MDSRKYQRDYYIEGNTARKLNAVPQEVERPRRRQQQEHQTNERIRRNTKNVRAFDFRYTVALLAATSVLFISCLYMLSIQARIMEEKRSIAILESNLNVLTDMNNETEKRLDNTIDLTKVYDVATKELHMVYPKTGQVIKYEASNPDYVKQYKDVPVK